MQLMQISDPNSNAKREIPKIAVGIDFGTTNSLVAIVKGDDVVIIPDQNGEVIIKSVISCDDNVFKVGNGVDSIQCIRSIKRLLGKELHTVKHLSQFNFVQRDDNNISIKCGDKILTPVEVVAHILNHLRSVAETYLKQKVKHTVITVPAYFSEIERYAIKDAAKIIGLKILRLINEPTAAALAYGLQNSKDNNEVYLVYDLGGGTFDVSILRKNKGVFQVLASGGDTLLGGDDFDGALGDFICDKYKLDYLHSKLLPIAHKIKEKLTSSDRAEEVFVDDGKKGYVISVTTQEFNGIISKDVERTIEITKGVISQANIDIMNINSVVLVGGSTRVPLIRDSVKAVFGEKKVLCDVDPDKIVVIGAAIQAHALTSNLSNNSVLIDVLPLSLGVEVMGGLMDVMIERNTPLPISKSRIFTTFCDGQTVMKISVYQGEREMIKHNKLLDCFELQGITPLKAGKAKIEVVFIVDADGLLTVEAMEDGDSVKKEISVSSNYGLSDEDVDRIVANSFQYARADLEGRELVESKMEGKTIIKSVEEVIESGEYGFSNIQLKMLENLLHDLKVTLEESDVDNIKSKIESLEQYFQPLIKDKINKYIKGNLIGSDIGKYRDNEH